MCIWIKKLGAKKCVEEKFLEVLPENFRHEKSFLIKNKLNDCKKLSKLSDSELNIIQKS